MAPSSSKLTIGTRFAGFRALLLRAQAGDRGAMDEVLLLLRPHLDRIARPYAASARPVASTTDLVQDACLRTWKNLGRFETRENDESGFPISDHISPPSTRAIARMRGHRLHIKPDCSASEAAIPSRSAVNKG